ETNIVLLNMSVASLTAGELVDAARADGVLVGAVGQQVVRLITHLDVTADDCRKAGDALARLLAA
ncbi:MAG TPA: hypothetical protein VFI46_05735, partial [Jiangellaceae bacterium]|nr:hypothetical protein [Jiangellaceae bacterium]